MATSFGPDATALPDIPSAQTPKEGVAQEPVLLKGLTNIFEQATAVAKSKQKDVVAEFTKRQLLIAESYAQGNTKSAAFAQSLMRKNLVEMLDANPHLAGEFLKAQAAITSLPGGAKIVDTGTDIENRFKAQRQEAEDMGILSYGASDDEAEKAIKTLQVAKASAENLKVRMDTLELESKNMSLSKAKREMAQQELEKASLEMGKLFVPLERDRMKNKFNEILNSNASEADKVMAMQDYFEEMKAQAAVTLIHLSSDDRNALQAPFQLMFDAYLDRAKGGQTDAETTRMVDRIGKVQELLMMQTPELARAITASKLMGHQPTVLAMINKGGTFTGYLGEYLLGTDPSNPDASVSPYVPRNDKEKRQALSTVLMGVSAGATSNDSELAEESVERIRRVLSDVDSYEGLLKKDKSSGIELVKWMSSKSFFDALQANPELGEDVRVAKDVIERNYSSNVWELISDKFQENKIVDWNSQFFDSDIVSNEPILTPTPDAVGFRSTSSGMEFYALDSGNSLAVSKAKDLNKDLKPIINTTVQAMSHLEGTTNYKEMWERVGPEIIGGGLADTGEQEGDLVLNDFQQTLEDSGSSGAPVGNVTDAGAGYTVVTLADGTKEKRTGTRSWRNNNPGNIEYGPFAKSQGAVGSDGRFAVFSSYEEGRAAKTALLFESKGYANKTIQGAINRYAPDFENDSVAYARTIARAAGVTVDTKLSDLSASQREALLDAMERVEGFKKGKVVKIQ